MLCQVWGRNLNPTGYENKDFYPDVSYRNYLNAAVLRVSRVYISYIRGSIYIRNVCARMYTLRYVCVSAYCNNSFEAFFLPFALSFALEVFTKVLRLHI